MTKSNNQLNNRKPFKLLAQFDLDELELVQIELQGLSSAYPGKLFPRLERYFQRWKELGAASNPVTRAEFVRGTDLPASANAFDKLTSSFYNFLQEFLARKELARDPVALQQLAFRAYSRRAFEWKEIRRRHGEAHREFDKLPQSSRLSHDRLVLDLDLASLANDRTISPKERGYPELLASLEANYVTQKLRLLCAIANDNKIFEAPSPDLSIASSLPPYRNTWPPLTRMYYGAYQLLTGEEDASSKATLRKLLEEQEVHSPTFPKEDMMDLYGYLLNALTRKVNQGNPTALQELSALYDLLIDKDILLENGHIASEHFKNVITVKLKTGEVAAARRVFDRLAGKINNDPDRNAYRYNHARLLFAEEQFEEAARELEDLCGQTGNLKLDFYYGLDIRVLLLKVYFDLLAKEDINPGYWDETDEKMVRLLESYRGYIERKKIPESRQQYYESFRRLIHAFYWHAFKDDPGTAGTNVEQLGAEMANSPQSKDAWFVTRLDWISRK